MPVVEDVDLVVGVREELASEVTTQDQVGGCCRSDR